MSLQIIETSNKNLEIENSANNLDKSLCSDLPFPLPNYSGFYYGCAERIGRR